VLLKKKRKSTNRETQKEILDIDKRKSSQNFIPASQKTDESSMTSENTENKKAIFKTFKGDDSHVEMRKMMRLMKNRLSARKCRQKKKSYVDGLEKRLSQLQNELDLLKKNQKKERHLENMISSVYKNRRFL
jgi:hypothetical protein